MFNTDSITIGETPAGMIDELVTFRDLFKDRLKRANQDHKKYKTKETKEEVKKQSALVSKCLNALRKDAKTSDVGFALIAAREAQKQEVGFNN